MENKDERIQQLEKENKEFKIYIDEVNVFVDQLQELAHEDESEADVGIDVLLYAVRTVRKYHALKRYIGCR